MAAVLRLAPGAPPAAAPPSAAGAPTPGTQYPYVPAHCTKPKEVCTVYVVQLPERQGYFDVPRNYRLVAVPLWLMHDNKQNYGVTISALPALLSRFRINI